MFRSVQPFKIGIILALVAVAVLLLVARPNSSPDLRQIAPPRVVVAAAAIRDLQPAETVAGRLRPARKAELSFEVAGQVSERHAEPGQHVAEGQVLLALEPGDYADALSDAEAQRVLEEAGVERDRQLLELAIESRKLQEQEVRRLKDLGKKSLASASRLDEAGRTLAQLRSDEARLRFSVETADARLRKQTAALERARRDLERTRLHAPFAGTINSVMADIGDYVSPNRIVAEIVDTGALDFYAELRGSAARGLSLGQNVPVTVDGIELDGEIIALQADPDPLTFTHAVRIRIPGDSVRSGELARTVLPLPVLHGVVIAPVTAILHEEGRSFVYREQDGVLQRVPVQTGERVDNWIVVREGLAGGETIVVRDVAALSDGQSVTPVNHSSE